MIGRQVLVSLLCIPLRYLVTECIDCTWHRGLLAGIALPFCRLYRHLDFSCTPPTLLWKGIVVFFSDRIVRIDYGRHLFHDGLTAEAESRSSLSRHLKHGWMKLGTAEAPPQGAAGLCIIMQVPSSICHVALSHRDRAASGLYAHVCISACLCAFISYSCVVKRRD